MNQPTKTYEEIQAEWAIHNGTSHETTRVAKALLVGFTNHRINDENPPKM